MRLSIHTIFVLRENILFMEEWIAYHLSIGFDHIYLYDNSKSIGRDGSTQTVNKYGYDFNLLTGHLSDHKIDKMLKYLLEKYKFDVTYIIWEPTGPGGNIIYGQNESILNYFKKYSGSSDWTAFIDMDEFIFSIGNIKELLTSYADTDMGKIIIHQKKFDDRFNNLDKPVTSIVNCIENIDTSGWAPKNFIKNIHFDADSLDDWNIHNLPIKNSASYLADKDEFRFNHYNVNESLLDWMSFFYKTSNRFSLDAKCYQLFDLYHSNKK